MLRTYRAFRRHTVQIEVHARAVLFAEEKRAIGMLELHKKAASFLVLAMGEGYAPGLLFFFGEIKLHSLTLSKIASLLNDLFLLDIYLTPCG